MRVADAIRGCVSFFLAWAAGAALAQEPAWVKLLDAPRWPAVTPQYYDHAKDPACSVKGPYFTGGFVSAADDRLTTGRPDAGKARSYRLRRVLTLRDTPTEAWLQAMGDRSATFGINGRQVATYSYSREPNVSPQPAVVSVTDRLKKGANTLTATYRTSAGFPGGVMLELFVRYADGSFERFVGDEEFESASADADDWKGVVLSERPPVPPRHHVWLTYRDFAAPQKLTGGGIEPSETVAGRTVTVAFDFAGAAPEGDFEAIVTMKKGGALAWYDRLTLGPRNIVRRGDGAWRLEIPFETPLYFTGGTYRLTLDINAIACEGGVRPTADLTLRRAPTVPLFDRPLESSVQDCGGTPQFAVNGKPFNLVCGGVAAFRRPDRRRTLGQAPATAVRVSNRYAEWHPKMGVYDFTCFDREAEMFRRGCPDAYFFWDLSIYPAPDFMTKYPGEMASDETGDISPVGRFSWSFASQRGLAEMKDIVEKAITYLENSPYANRIIGYRVNSGVTIEWLGWEAKPGQVRDFSEPNKAAFRAFAAERYPALADPHVPGYAERFATDGEDILWDQQKHLNAVAYMDYNSWIIQRDILEICGRAKEVLAGLGRKKVVGTYYGYTFHLNVTGRDQRRGHFDLHDLLKDNRGRVDFLMSPQSYTQRYLGDTCADMKPFTTMQKAGVVPFVEDDTRTHVRPYPTSNGWDELITEEQSVTVFRRNMYIALCHRCPPFYYALSMGTDYDLSSLADEARLLKDVSSFVLERKCPRRAEVALVMSEKSITSMPALNRWVRRGVANQSYRRDGSVGGCEASCAILNGEINSDLLNTFARSGAPVDYVLADDLARSEDDYRLYVFLNAFVWDEAMKASVERIRARGATILWLYAPGWIKDNANALSNMKELTGIDFERMSEPMVAGVTLGDGRFMGTPKEKVSPLFAPTAPERTYGRYENGKPGLASFHIGNSLTYFSGAWQLDRTFVRALYRRAGVHVYCESDDPTEAGADLFTLHTRNPGRKTVKLPRKAATVVDVVNRRIVARDTDTFAFDAPLHSTHLFYFGDGGNELLSKLTETSFESAQPVWAGGRQAETNLTVSFRTSFEWNGGAAPVCRIAAATVYRAFLNGEFVSWGPARTVGGFACVDEFKLAPKPGRNVLTVEVAGYNVSSYQYSGDMSFLCAEVVQDGTSLASTPSDFEAVEAPRAKTGPVYSRQRGFVAEGYEIDRDWVKWMAGEKSARPRLKLAVVPSPRWRTRASARPAFRPNTSFAAEKGHWALPSVDSGFVGLTFRCLKPGKISVEFDEALDKDGRIDIRRNGDPLTSWHAMLNRITWDVMEPGEYCVETMEPYTMRYVRTVTDGGSFEDVRPTLRQCRNPGMEKATFDCSDQEINRLFAAAKESVAQNAVDIFTDCPSRERVGWLCDTYFTANAAAWLSGDFAMEREYLLNFTLTDDFGPKIPKGAVPGFMPSRSGGLMPTYAMWYVIQCVQAASRLRSSARQAFAARVRSRIEGIVGFLQSFEREGLLEDLPGWVFIEWSKANDYVKGVNFPANMLWARALDDAGCLLGRRDWTEKAKAVRARTLELSMEDGRFHDQALRGADGRLKLNDAASTEVCQYYAFFTDLATPLSHPKLWRTLVDEVGPGRLGHSEMDAADAFIGWMLRCELLSRYGESKELYRSIKSYYGRMAEASGTLWEFADGHDSRCHAFAGNIAALIFREAFGIERIDWANKTVSWREPSAALVSARGRIPVPGGEISVEIGCENGRPIRKFSLPGGWHWRRI